VLLRLPQIPLPHWAAGVQLGGPVTLESTLAAAYDGLRLATLLCCVGAANALANPKPALRVLPGALYELGMAVVVSVTVAPQLIESAQRVRRARQLRGGGNRDGLRLFHTVALPVLQDALDRCLQLAAAMDSRGYGRRGDVTVRTRRTTTLLLIGGLAAMCFGAYGLLDGTGSTSFGLPALLVGAAVCGLGLALGSRRVWVTSYRPHPWRAPEWIVAGCGLGSAVVLLAAGHYDAGNLNPSLEPLSWPTLPLAPLLGILLGAVAGIAAPPVPKPHPRAAVARPDPTRVPVGTTT
jgi:energy-coupling factor transport system permease protein